MRPPSCLWAFFPRLRWKWSGAPLYSETCWANRIGRSPPKSPMPLLCNLEFQGQLCFVQLRAFAGRARLRAFSLSSAEREMEVRKLVCGAPMRAGGLGGGVYPEPRGGLSPSAPTQYGKSTTRLSILSSSMSNIGDQLATCVDDRDRRPRERAAVQQAAGDVVEPETPAEVVQLAGRFHRVTPMLSMQFPRSRTATASVSTDSGSVPATAAWSPARRGRPIPNRRRRTMRTARR